MEPARPERPGGEAREATWTAWMRAAIGGDVAAYRRLLEALTPVLRAAATRGFARAGQGTSDVEDIVQETLLAIHLKRHTWDMSQPLMPWVVTIARHKLIDHLRRRGRRIDLPVEDFAETLAAPADRDPTEAGDVERMLGRLGERRREVIRAIAVEDRSITETARRLGMSEGAVRVALHRGLKALAALREQEP